MKKLFLTAAAALVLSVAAGEANADSVSGTLGGSYANDTSAGGSDLWNIDGSLTGRFDGNWGLEAVGGYHGLSGDLSPNLDIWNIGGSAFWGASTGRVAASVNYYSTSITGIDLHVTSYGVGGEWYAGPNFTVALKGGGNTVDVSGFGASASESGGYAGGMLQWYALPNFAVSGAVDYAKQFGGHATSETIKGEWLFSSTMPVSLFGGYQHVDVNAGGAGFAGGDAGDILFVGLKFYMNGDGSQTLVDRQRNGSLGYIAEAPVVGLPTN
jgi:hypothetical protein